MGRELTEEEIKEYEELIENAEQMRLFATEDETKEDKEYKP